MIDPELVGPSPGDRVLVVSTDTDMAELLRIIFKRRRIDLTIVPTVAEATRRLDEAFNIVWLRSPLPDFHTQLFSDLLEENPDWVHSSGMEDPLRVSNRIRKSAWPLERERSLLDGVETPRGDEEWVWVRVCTGEERERLRHLLEKCKRRKAAGRQ
jgi:hypothetical protein